MPTSKLANIYAQDLLNQALINEAVRKSVVWNSGMVATDPELSQLVATGEGRKINRVGYNDLPEPVEGGNTVQAGVHNPGYMDDSDTLLVPNNTDTWEYTNVKCATAYALGEKQIIKTCNWLPDPVAALNTRVSTYWAKFFDMYAIAMLMGVFADNVANDGLDMVYGDGTDPVDETLLIEGWGTMGDAAELGSGIFICHSMVAKSLRKQQLIDTIASADNPHVNFEYFQGARMLVSDQTPLYTNGADDTCLSILAQPGTMEFGQSTNGIIPSETWRDPRSGVGGGEEMLITRQLFSMGITGFSWEDDTVTGSVAAGAIGGLDTGTKLFPSIADQRVAANWDRVLDRKKIKIAFVHTSEKPA